MLLIKVIITSAFLFFGSKYLKLKDNTIFTALKVAAPYHVYVYLWAQDSNPIYLIIGYGLIIIFIKYFYKIDLKKSIFLWLFTLLAGIITIFALGLLEAIYRLIT